jgi:hypothetical protein
MSALSIASTNGLSAAGLPPIDPATEPAVIRNGTQTAKNAYQTGLAFEQLLVNELATDLSQTVSAGSSTDGSSDDSDDSSDSSTSSSGASNGLLGSGPASSMYEQMLPQALTSSIMAAGGTGVALQIAKGIDPSIGAKS